MWVLVMVVLGVVALSALAWWSSGRSRHRVPGPGAAHEVARGEGYWRGQQQRNADMGNPLL